MIFSTLVYDQQVCFEQDGMLFGTYFLPNHTYCCFKDSVKDSLVDLREGSVFCRENEEMHDRTLLSYLLADNDVDRVDQGNIKGGSSFYA